MRRRHAAVVSVVAWSLWGGVPADAQWTNRYAKNAGYGHHVYLEGYELPSLANGPMGTAIARDGRMMVASRGWLWTVDTAGVARRLTAAAESDARPAWAPDGRSVAFARDDGRTLALMVRTLADGVERELDRGMVLDPVFSPDGAAIIYASAAAGDLDLWRVELSTGVKTRLTTDAGLQLRPLPLPDGQRLVYLSKTRGGGDQLRLRWLRDNSETMLVQGQILSQLRPALSADGSLVAYAIPGALGWELWLLSIDRPMAPLLLWRRDGGLPIDPAFSADGRFVYFSEADATQRMRFYRVAVSGGAAVEVPIDRWESGVPMGRLVIETRCRACATPVAARLEVRDAVGHSLVPDSGMVRFDGQNGRTYFYSPGQIGVAAPAGAVRISAVRGLATREVTVSAVVRADAEQRVTVELDELWPARANGWVSADHHFHLNYGGAFRLAPTDLRWPMEGEALDVGTPMLANLANRFEDQALFAWQPSGDAPLITWAQEIRSHFLGHVGLIGTSSIFWPWVWGPGYDVYGRDDRTNADAIRFARAQQGLGIYVHPVQGAATPAGMATAPLELVADAAQGLVDLLEIVCLWSSARGTTDLWYQLLNAGMVIAPSGGTDAMTDLHRTMALGATRVVVKVDGPLTWASYREALRRGRSFVTTGPMVQLTVDGMLPGDVVTATDGSVPFTLTVASAVPVDSVSLVVNGVAAWRAPRGEVTDGVRTYRGRLRVPSGGWIAARVTGPATTRWPAMADMAFAHTAPIWIGSRGSTEPGARRAAAVALGRLLASNVERLEVGYLGTEIPRLRAHFTAARAVLDSLAR
ncbi:MAG: CehA/McbA family metallohydrolase [Gemmatimonadaceae bacterium]|jgi:TolB protein|nr:CehA/McbA family metallohydrolase [Gemmatimonadaceae bacterium]